MAASKRPIATPGGVESGPRKPKMPRVTSTAHAGPAHAVPTSSSLTGCKVGGGKSAFVQWNRESHGARVDRASHGGQPLLAAIPDNIGAIPTSFKDSLTELDNVVDKFPLEGSYASVNSLFVSEEKLWKIMDLRLKFEAASELAGIAYDDCDLQAFELAMRHRQRAWKSYIDAHDLVPQMCEPNDLLRISWKNPVQLVARPIRFVGMSKENINRLQRLRVQVHNVCNAALTAYANGSVVDFEHLVVARRNAWNDYSQTAQRLAPLPAFMRLAARLKELNQITRQFDVDMTKPMVPRRISIETSRMLDAMLHEFTMLSDKAHEAFMRRDVGAYYVLSFARKHAWEKFVAAHACPARRPPLPARPRPLPAEPRPLPAEPRPCPEVVVVDGDDDDTRTEVVE
jgi:hypothetical protein